MGTDMLTAFLAGQADNNNSGNNGNNGGFFGNEGLWAVIILAIIFGWGNGNGFGNRGGNNCGGENNVTYVPYPAMGFGGFGGSCGCGGGGALTRADLCSEFNFNDLQSAVRGISNGICDSTYAITGAVNTGFSQAELSRCNQQAALMQMLNNMAFQSKDCCCETQRLVERGFCDAGYNAATNTANIIQAGHNDTDRVIAKLCDMESARQAEKIEALRLENQTLRFQASQTAQNGYIDAIGNSVVARLQQPQPVPSYSVPAPYPYCVPNNCNSGCNSCGC